MISGLALGVGATALQGCDDLAEKCGLVCPSEGILQGNASISGIASVDAFFDAVIDFNAAMNSVSVNIRAELDSMAVSLGLEPGAAGADIKAAIDAKISAAVSGGLKIKAQPAQCSASAEITASAAAKCDVNVEPGSVEVECNGSCAVSAEAAAQCQAEVNLTCSGTAPNLNCEGSCEGSCNLEVAASCEGTCRGDCSGECSVRDSQGNCAGECSGMCEGECELAAGGKCEGKCEGTCEYTPGEAGCEGNVEAKCNVSASAEVKCEGKCEGEVKPPEVSAECEASVEAKASASIECTPPSIEITWQWSASFEGNTDARGEFRAWMRGFRGQLSALLAATAKAEILVDGVANLTAAADVAVKGAAAELQGSGDLKASIGAGCALGQLGNVAGLLGQGSGRLRGELSASLEISAMAGG